MSLAQRRDRDGVEAIRASRDALLGLLGEVWQNGREFVARCPLHADKTPSLTVYRHPADGVWMWRCFPCGKGGDVFSLMRAQGVEFLDALAQLGGEARRPNFQQGPRPDKAGYGARGAPRGKIATLYNYDDENRILLYQVVRMEPKDFRQRRPDGSGGWIWRLGDVRRVLYRLPQLLHRPRDTVYVVEGEKDADRLANAGLVATSNCGGASAWRPQYAESLRGRRVVIIPDNDEPGIKHARDVFDSLRGVAQSLRLVRLPGAGPKWDVSDWLDAGNHVGDLPK